MDTRIIRNKYINYKLEKHFKAMKKTKKGKIAINIPYNIKKENGVVFNLFYDIQEIIDKYHRGDLNFNIEENIKTQKPSKTYNNEKTPFKWVSQNVKVNPTETEHFKGELCTKEFVDYLIEKVKENKLENFKFHSTENSYSISYSLNESENENPTENDETEGCECCNECDELLEDKRKENEENDIDVSFINNDEFNKKFGELIKSREKLLEERKKEAEPKIKNKTIVSIPFDVCDVDIKEISFENGARYFCLNDLVNLFSIIDAYTRDYISEVSKSNPNDIKLFKGAEDLVSYVYVNYKFIVELIKYMDIKKHIDVIYDVWCNLIVDAEEFNILSLKQKFVFFNSFIEMVNTN